MASGVRVNDGLKIESLSFTVGLVFGQNSMDYQMNGDLCGGGSVNKMDGHKAVRSICPRSSVTTATG